FGGNAARGQIEQLFVFQLPNGRAVSALHVVGENLQLRLRVHVGVGRQQQVFIQLPRVGQQRAFAHEDLAVENRARTPVENTLIKLVTGRMRFLVINRRVVVTVLASGNHVQPVNRRFDILIGQRDVQVVARDLTAQRDGV